MLPETIAAVGGDHTSFYYVSDTIAYIESIGHEISDDEILFHIGSWAFEDFDGKPHTLIDYATGEAL
jgi:hypothetical protein